MLDLGAMDFKYKNLQQMNTLTADENTFSSRHYRKSFRNKVVPPSLNLILGCVSIKKKNKKIQKEGSLIENSLPKCLRHLHPDQVPPARDTQAILKL